MKLHLILITDIYGKNIEVTNFSLLLIEQGYSVSVISPYDRHISPLSNEELYYQAFLNECGHDKYAKKVKELKKG